MKNIPHLMLAFFAFSATSVFAQEITPPVIEIKMCEKSPVIDGKLDDPCWKNAYSTDKFYLFKNPAETTGATLLKIIADHKFLYFGVKCSHPEPAKMKLTVFKSDGPRVFGDECVKMFINPGVEGDKFFRFVLNAAGASRLINQVGVSNDPRRVGKRATWPSAVSTNDQGWEAEIAIPLYFLKAYGDISKLKLNFFRRQVINEYDSQAALVGEKSIISTLAPCYKAWVEMDNMAQIKGLGKITVHIPFLARFYRVKITEPYETNGKLLYNLDLQLYSMTGNCKGEVKIIITETDSQGISNEITKIVKCDHVVNKFLIPLPIKGIGKKAIKIVLQDVKTSAIFGKTIIEGDEPFNCFLGRSYYTTENFANAHCTCSLPNQLLKGKKLIVQNDKGAKFAEKDDLEPMEIIPVPLKNLKCGNHILTVKVINEKDQTIFKKELTLKKLKPKPGCEWKIDRVNNVILRNGKPFFPFGVWSGVGDVKFKEIADVGFNFVHLMGTSNSIKVPQNYPEVMKNAEKYGLTLNLRPSSLSRPMKLKTLDSKIKDKATLKKAYKFYGGCNFLLNLKGMLLLDPVLLKLTRAERTAIYDEAFQKFKPTIIKTIKNTMNFPCMAGYCNIDEPSSATYDMWKIMKKIRDTFDTTDGYHPSYVLYCTEIHGGEEHSKAICDVLGIDPYWCPGRPETDYRGSINIVAWATALLKERCKKEHLVPWVTPAASNWSATHKRSLSGKEIACQTYLALIHGAKMITYYLYSSADHQTQRDTFVRLAKEVKKLSPALTAPKVPQKINYLSDEYAPEKRTVPDVQTCLMKYPEGKYILLVANSRPYPCESKITVTGLKGPVKNIFSQKEPTVMNEIIQEKLEAHATRVYDIDEITVTDEPIKIRVESIPDNKGYKPEIGYGFEGRKEMRNILPNPSFEEDTLKNWPDYYRLLSAPSPNPRVGHPDCSWSLTTLNPYHGKKCLRSKNNWCFYIAPKHKKPTKYIFSAYMKTDKPNNELLIMYGKQKKRIKVKDNQWRRYSFFVDIPANLRISRFTIIPMDRNATTWFDALQFEEIPEFEP